MNYIGIVVVLTIWCSIAYGGGRCTRPCRPCIKLPDCNTTTLDDCGCCEICVRGLDEQCGGAFGIYGKCERGLECNLISSADHSGAPEFTGVCKNATGKPDCDSVKCPPFSFECPWDSQYVEGDTPPNRCCKVPGKCECDHTKCNNVNCPVGYIKQLQSPARNTPSQCCDTYECLPEKMPVGVCSDPQTGLKYEDGEYWNKNECTGCTCFAGAAKCYNIDCPRLSCAFPVKPVNACCPRCPKNSECGDFKCDLDCEQGFVNDHRDCPMCQCNVRKECNLIDCDKDCPNGYKIGSDGCELCTCHTCHPMRNCNINCGYGLEKDVRGCAICKCITDSEGNEHPPEIYQCYDNSGIMHPEGSSWEPNPCSRCTCYRGSSVCSIVDCYHKCSNPIQRQGECCPVCEEGCTDNSGIHRREGEEWKSGCLDCNCRNSTVQCHPLQCPMLQCTDSVSLPGQCCQVCPSVVHNIVPEAEQEFVVVVAASESLGALQERQSVFLQHLSSGNEYVFRLKLLFASDIQRLRDKPGKITEMGSIALVNALEKATSSLIRAEKVVPRLQILSRVEPDVVKVMTYPDYLRLTQTKALTHSSKLSSVVIAVTAIAAVVFTLLLLGYFGRRHLRLAHRRKFKHTASMGRSADQLINAVDNSRLAIHPGRPRQISVDSMLSQSPSPLDVPPFPGGHDNLGNYNKINTS